MPKAKQGKELTRQVTWHIHKLLNPKLKKKSIFFFKKKKKRTIQGKNGKFKQNKKKSDKKKGGKMGKFFDLEIKIENEKKKKKY